MLDVTHIEVKISFRAEVLSNIFDIVSGLLEDNPLKSHLEGLREFTATQIFYMCKGGNGWVMDSGGKPADLRCQRALTWMQ